MKLDTHLKWWEICIAFPPDFRFPLFPSLFLCDDTKANTHTQHWASVFFSRFVDGTFHVSVSKNWPFFFFSVIVLCRGFCARPLSHLYRQIVLALFLSVKAFCLDDGIHIWWHADPQTSSTAGCAFIWTIWCVFCAQLKYVRYSKEAKEKRLRIR